MKLPQSLSGKKEMKQETVQSPKKEETVMFGLKQFKEKYPENITTPLVYFDEGMKPVKSIYTDMIDLSRRIVEEDKFAIDTFVKNNDYENLADFVIVRREDVSIQFSNRVLFLARSLALNFHTRILKALGSISVDIARNTYNYREDPIEFITNIIFEYMKKYITMPSYVSVNPSTDYIFSYTATSSIIPMIISEVYDLYDEAIVKFSTDSITFYKNANDIEEKIKAAESIHLQMLNVILPIFESLNSQIEWLSYMVRDEARSIYRPMAMEEAGVILNNHLQEMKKHEEVIHGEHGDITIGHF